MSNDNIKGRGKQVKGNLKEKWGKLTDDEKDEVSGKMDKAAGKVQEGYGKIKDKVSEETEGRKNNMILKGTY